MTRRTAIPSVALAAAALLALGACGDDSTATSTTSAAAPTTAGTPTTTVPARTTAAPATTAAATTATPTTAAPTTAAPTTAAPTSAGATTTAGDDAPASTNAPPVPATTNPDGSVTIKVAVGTDDFDTTGGKRVVAVKKGTPVTIELTDPATKQTYHLHGYDIEVDADKGATGKISFTADQTGQFDLESHATNATLLVLVVV